MRLSLEVCGVRFGFDLFAEPIDDAADSAGEYVDTGAATVSEASPYAGEQISSGAPYYSDEDGSARNRGPAPIGFGSTSIGLVPVRW